jgi:putative sterol carrier protein
VTAERREGDADVVIRVDETLFEHICAGRTNATAALLRGAYRVEGDLELVMHFHRVLPAPPIPDEVLTQGATGGDRRDR